MSEKATAGPPFLTDDPEPVELGHYEFYTFSTGAGVKDDTSGVLPGFEFNYGLIPNGQLHIIARTAFDHPAEGPTNFGLGDTELGFKYRFIQEQPDGARPQVGVFPLIELPTGDQGRGLGAGHVSLYLPLWIQKSFGEWTTYGGGGYWINQDKKLGDRDYWFAGWLLQRQVTKALGSVLICRLVGPAPLVQVMAAEPAALWRAVLGWVLHSPARRIAPRRVPCADGKPLRAASFRPFLGP